MPKPLEPASIPSDDVTDGTPSAAETPDASALRTADLSKSERETLKAIPRRTKDATDAHTGDLAETLGVTPGTVTATVKRLADRQLVAHRPYHGVRFTPAGRRLAVSAIRRHRVVERFLADMLGYAWNE